MEGISSASAAMVVGQTTESTNRIRRLVTTIIIISSSNSLSSSLRKAVRHHSLTLNFLASLLTSSRYLEFVPPTFNFLCCCCYCCCFSFSSSSSSSSSSSYECLGQLLLFIYFIRTAQWNNVSLMGLVNYGPVYNVYTRNSKLYLPFQSPPSCIGPQILLNTSLSNSSRFHSPGCKCIQHSAPYLAIGLITVLYTNFRCQWHGPGFRCFCRSN